MEGSTPTLPRTTAAPVASDFIHSSCSPLVVWVSSSSKGPGCCWMQSAPAHTLVESCDPSPPVAFLFSVVSCQVGVWGAAGPAGEGGSCSCGSVSQGMGEARALACPGQGQETGGFAEAQTGRSVERPMSRCRKATRMEAGMGDTLLSPELGRAETHAECCVWGCCLGQGDQTSRHHLPP